MVPSDKIGRIVRTRPGPNTGDIVYEDDLGRVWLKRFDGATIPMVGDLIVPFQSFDIFYDLAKPEPLPTINELKAPKPSGHRALPEFQRRQRIRG